MTQAIIVLEGLQKTEVKVLSGMNSAESICSCLLSPCEMHPDFSETKDVNGEKRS